MKFSMDRKKPNVIPIQKNIINSASKITDLSLCFRSAVRSLKDFYLTNCTILKMKMTYYHPTSQAFDQVTLVRPSDSCINQLLSITHEIYQSFDNDLEVRGV